MRDQDIEVFRDGTPDCFIVLLFILEGRVAVAEGMRRGEYGYSLDFNCLVLQINAVFLESTEDVFSSQGFSEISFLHVSSPLLFGHQFIQHKLMIPCDYDFVSELQSAQTVNHRLKVLFLAVAREISGVDKDITFYSFLDNFFDGGESGMGVRDAHNLEGSLHYKNNIVYSVQSIIELTTMQDIEEIEELYQKIPQSIIAQFFTNLEAYATGETEMHIPTDFTEKTLDELIKNLLQEQVEQVILERIGFQFLIDGKLLRGKLKSHLVRYSISCEQTLRIEYVLGFGEMSQNEEKEEDDWIGAIAEMMGVSSNKLAVGLFSGGISLYGDDNVQMRNFAADKDAISCIKVLPASHEDEYFSIYGGIDEQIRVQLISFNKEKVQNQLLSENDHEGSLLGLDVNPALDGLICSVGSSGRIKVWQINAGFEKIEANVVKDLGNKKKKKILSLNSLPLVATSKIHESSIEAVCWMNTHQIITGSSDHSIGIVDAERLEIVRKLFTKDSITTQLDCSSGRVISSHEDGFIRLWDIREGTSPSSTFKSHTKLASCVRFHRNHNVFASGAYDHTVKVWDCRSMFPLQNIGTHLDKVLSLCWKNENELASGGSDSKLVFHKIGGQ